MNTEPTTVPIYLSVSWRDECDDKNDNNNGKEYGIYTYEVPIEDVDTEDMYNNEIVDVEWFKTEKKRDKVLSKKPNKFI